MFREQRERIAAIDGGASGIRQEPGFVGAHRFRDHTRIGKRIIGPEHDALRPRDMIERAERLFPRRERVVVPEMRQAGINLIARELREPLVDHRRYREPPGEIGHQPAGMRQDEPNARETLDRAGENEVHHRTRGVEQVFHHEARPRQCKPLARGMQAGMDEHDSGALVQHREHGIERRIAQELAAVAREQRNTIESEGIETVSDLIERALRAPHRDGDKGAEAPGPACHQLGGIFVAAPRQELRAFLCAKSDPGLRQRGERDLDAVGVHDIERERRGPVRIFADGGTAARGIDRVAVERRNQVEMDVDPACC